jgi:hypothetical protein
MAEEIFFGTKPSRATVNWYDASEPWHGYLNRVGGVGLVPTPTSHTTVRTVRYTAVP